MFDRMDLAALSAATPSNFSVFLFNKGRRSGARCRTDEDFISSQSRKEREGKGREERMMGEEGGGGGTLGVKLVQALSPHAILFFM